MIKFVHKKHADREKGKARIIITYTGFEIFLGLLLLFTNISAIILIYNYVLHPSYPYQTPSMYTGKMPMMPATPKNVSY